MQWPHSHLCYLPSRAIHASAPYTMRYLHPCGPYTIALKAALPPFDRRWRDSALSRSGAATHMASWGFHFHVGVNMFMVRLPAGAVPPLKAPPPAGEIDGVYNDMVALPHALTRVQLEEMRGEEEHVCDITPSVPPLTREEVAEVMQQDGADGDICWNRFSGLRWWEVSDAARQAVLPDCAAPGPCAELPLGMGLIFEAGSAPPQAHVALWAMGGGVVAWALFVWFWGSAMRRKPPAQPPGSV